LHCKQRQDERYLEISYWRRLDSFIAAYSHECGCHGNLPENGQNRQREKFLAAFSGCTTRIRSQIDNPRSKNEILRFIVCTKLYPF
jgi:hypothetical protein